MDKELVLGYTLTGLQTIFTSIQDNEIYQVIQMVLSLLSGALVIAYTIWKWYVRAKKDGKITIEEIDDGIEELIDAIDYIEENKESDK